MNFMPRSHFSFHQRRRGFALLVTIVLVALLVLVLVGLATFTRVETQVADNSQKQEVARQHALTAMNIALGRLQEGAGPDTKITVVADTVGGVTNGRRKWTGVWDGSGAALTDYQWLVSGSQLPDGAGLIAENLMPGYSSSATPPDSARYATLVTMQSGTGTATFRDENRVNVLLENFEVPENKIPGLNASVTTGRAIGRFGYWVGDEGVKASMALPLQTNLPTYEPYDTATARRILRTQVPMGPQDFVTDAASSSSAALGFDPQFNGASPMKAFVARAQGGMLQAVPSVASLSDQWRDNFHNWTTISYGVLAKTSGTGGLKEDLSRDPTLLGNAFRDWAAGAHVRPDTDAVPPQALTGPADARRTHNLVAEVSSSSPDFRHRVAPVIMDFYIHFAPFFTYPAPHEPRLRSSAVVGLWNPYSSGIVLDTDLILEVRNLPTLDFTWAQGATTFPISIDLNTVYTALSGGSGTSGMRLRLKLPGGNPIYLRPGAQISWSSDAATDKTATVSASVPGSSALNLSLANVRDMINLTQAPAPLPATQVTAADGFWEHLPAGAPTFAAPPTTAWDQANDADLRLVLTTEEVTPRELADVTMSTFVPANRAATSGATARAAGYAYRLRQLAAASTTPGGWWWTEPGYDPRAPRTQDYIPYNGTDDNATAYSSRFGVGSGSFLLEAPTGTTNLYRDVPLFELPRLPVLSIGQLQHLRVDGEPAYALGNTWGNGGNGFGSLWDDYFFSGLTTQVVAEIGASDPLPYFHLRSLVDSNATLAGLGKDTAQQLLLGGAFNINSTSREAWRAVLQSLRPFAPAETDTEAWRSVDYLDNTTNSSTPATVAGEGTVTMVRDGTRGDTTGTPPVAEETASRASGFARFPQTAQEVWEYNEGNAATTEPEGIARVRYRGGIRAGTGYTTTQQGVVRNLSRDDIDLLAGEIVTLVRTYVQANGPFPSMAEFIRRRGGVFNNRSLLEEAIFRAGINTRINMLDPTATPPATPASSTWNEGFSSAWLSQADVLTALGGQMQTRSDTFLIRAYGDVVNPVTAQVEGRAWCEARVQRMPAAASPATFGRQFQIVDFRWLSSSDL
jgi:hypothetical protein